MDEEERAMEEPHPDVHQLFCHYNSLYFSDALGCCFVSWNPSRTTRSTSFCSYMEAAACEIHLSELLLKGRTADDVKNTLLHEMIHAFLYVTSNLKDHSYHGPKFKAKMNEINSSFLTDPQRPSSGYSITIHHQFQKKVDSYIVHHWICQTCGDRIERAMDIIPSASDCVENMGHGKSCGNSSCLWHKHKILCSGTYKKVAESPDTKVAELPEYKGIRRLSKAKHKDDGETPDGPTHARRRTVRRLQPTEFSKTMADESGSLGIKPSCGNDTGNGSLFPRRGKSKQMKASKLENEDSLAEGGKSKQMKGSRLENEGSLAEGGKSRQMKAIKLENEGSVAEGGKDKQTKADKLEKEDALAAVIPKRARTPGSRTGSKEKKKSRKCKRDPTEPLINVAIPWLDYYAHESSEEDTVPLINKRTERRKKRKLLIEQKGRCPDLKSIDGAYSFGYGSFIDSPLQCRGYEQRFMSQTTPEDKRVTTEDDIVNLSDG